MADGRKAQQTAVERSALAIDHALLADRHFVNALARGVSVLRCFGPKDRALGTSEIARRTSLAQPTAWRLCHTLSKLGLLVYDPETEKYQVGLAVMGLGVFALPSTDIGVLAQEEMRKLALRFGAAVSLCVPENTNMLITSRSVGHGLLMLNLDVGSRFEIAGTTPGAAYAASLSDTARADLYQVLAELHGKAWEARRRSLETGRAQLAETGFVYSAGEMRPEISSVAAPIVIEPDTKVFSLTCGGPVASLSRDLLVNEVGPAVALLAENIGAILRANARGIALDDAGHFSGKATR